MSKNTINRITDVECLRVFGGQKDDEVNSGVPDQNTFNVLFSLPDILLRSKDMVLGGGRPVLNDEETLRIIEESLNRPNWTAIVVDPEDV